MPFRNTAERYGAVAQTLHWLIVALIVVQVTTAFLADDMPFGPHKAAMLGRHKSFGMTILMLMVLRLGWRFANPSPRLPAATKPYERGLAKITHYALYAILFAMPLSGWVLSAAKNFPVSWFHLFTWPNPVAPDADLAEGMEELHETLAIVLGVTVTLHILAALRHHFLLKDDVLKRMLPARKGTS